MNPSVLIADDEPLLREQLERFVTRFWPEATIISVASNGAEARVALQEKRPDVAFLDIRMPAPDGLELAEEFASEPILIVFVTAYDQYAVSAFERDASDYLLKPISEERFKETVSRLKVRLEYTRVQQTVESIGREIEKLKQLSYLERIPVHHRGETKFVPINEIRFFKADTKYTLAVDSTNEYVLSVTLRELEEQLDSNDFWRIHRNCIVNVNFIETARAIDKDSLVLQIRDRAEELRVSRTYRHRFREI